MEEDDFDWPAEMQAFQAMGFVVPEPIIKRVERLSRVVSSLGWEAARDLVADEFRGWEADFLPNALVLLKE